MDNIRQNPVIDCDTGKIIRSLNNMNISSYPHKCIKFRHHGTATISSRCNGICCPHVDANDCTAINNNYIFNLRGNDRIICKANIDDDVYLNWPYQFIGVTNMSLVMLFNDNINISDKLFEQIHLAIGDSIIESFNYSDYEVLLKLHNMNITKYYKRKTWYIEIPLLFTLTLNNNIIPTRSLTHHNIALKVYSIPQNNVYSFIKLDNVYSNDKTLIEKIRYERDLRYFLQSDVISIPYILEKNVFTYNYDKSIMKVFGIIFHFHDDSNILHNKLFNNIDILRDNKQLYTYSYDDIEKYNNGKYFVIYFSDNKNITNFDNIIDSGCREETCRYSIRFHEYHETPINIKVSINRLNYSIFHITEGMGGQCIYN